MTIVSPPGREPWRPSWALIIATFAAAGALTLLAWHLNSLTPAGFAAGMLFGLALAGFGNKVET